MKLQVGKTYKTFNGEQEYLIISDKGQGKFNYIGQFLSPNSSTGNYVTACFREDGARSIARIEKAWSLVPNKVKKSGWGVIYKYKKETSIVHSTKIYESKEAALHDFRNFDRVIVIDVHLITWEEEE